MIQHHGSIKNFFIYNANKTKNKRAADKHHLVLNLKKMCFYFSKQIKHDSKCLKKTKAVFIKQTLFSLNMLIIVFTLLIIQKFVKKIFFLCKKTIKKARFFSKNIGVFIKNSFYVFIPQHRLKEQ